MPTYVYQVVTDAGDGEVFEVRQPITDEPLKRHPETGQPVRRLLTAPTVVSRSPDEAGKALASDKRLDQLGFTKYVKTSEGKYEKRAGQGPKTLRRDDV